MNSERLIHNANQIAAYFAAYPQDEAVKGVADHVNRFWEKRLRHGLRELLTAREPRLHPLVMEAGPLILG